jgi:DNA-binding transcriptional MerR regulator
MATVGDLSRIFQVSPQTVRSWCDTFKEYLSPGATPPQGEARIFNEEDVSVLALVAQLRQDLVTFEDIHQALTSGLRGRPPLEEPEPSVEYPPAPLMAQEIARYQGELRATQRELERLHGDLREEREARLEAEKRASRIEAQLEILQGLRESQSPPQVVQDTPREARPADPPRRPWWRIW